MRIVEFLIGWDDSCGYRMQRGKGWKETENALKIAVKTEREKVESRNAKEKDWE